MKGTAGSPQKLRRAISRRIPSQAFFSAPACFRGRAQHLGEWLERLPPLGVPLGNNICVSAWGAGCLRRY